MNLTQQIKNSRQSPIIGIIGATLPNRSYLAQEGVQVGYQVRRFVEAIGKGSIFTGGVSGVGVDAYRGVLKFCKEKKSGFGDDTFFVMVPTNFEYFSKELRQVVSLPYRPPRIYEELAASSKSGKLDIIRAGENMLERRKYVASVADVQILVNGGLGTLEEALMSMKNGIPVIAVKSTGGVARKLPSLRDNPGMLESLYEFEEEGPEIDLKGINFDLLKVVANPLEVFDMLGRVIQN